MTAGQTYDLTFDLLVLDSWDGLGSSSGPDTLTIDVDGEFIFTEAFSNIPGARTTYEPQSPGSFDLQIVPVINRITERPGVDADFRLFGSGFMEGMSTLTIDGTTVDDPFVDQVLGDVRGNNNEYVLHSRFTNEGPIRLTTNGGFFEINGPEHALPAFVELNSIESVATLGIPANSNVSSANTTPKHTQHI